MNEKIEANHSKYSHKLFKCMNDYCETFDLHYCEGNLPYQAYGSAINDCSEDEDREIIRW